MGGKVLYFEAPDGISGDMTLGALIDAGADIDSIRLELDKFVPGEYAIHAHPFERNGIHGVNLEVLVDDEYAESRHEHGHGGEPHHSHSHRSYADIKKMIADSGISQKAKDYALAIFETIAEAEAAVHQMETEEVSFHEVGAMDSIIDIVGTAVAISLLDVDEFYTSAPRDGSGTIVCRHGLIPVPVPAVMEMAKNAGIPIIIEHEAQTEMITPTGFGIIKGLKAKFEPSFGIIPEKTGYGFGKRDTGRLGAVRVTIGEKYEEAEEKQEK